MTGIDFALLVAYLAIAILMVPTAMAAAAQLKKGGDDYPPMPPMYADFIASLGVAFWPIFLAVGLYLGRKDP